MDEERAAQRAALGPRLTQILVNVQVEHEHQRACALLLAERFARGDPGALLSMDTGLGKTHVVFLLVGALLQVGVPCVVATERALEANLLERFKAVWPGVDVSRLKIIVSGAAPSHRVVLERAIASIEGDGVVFIDEVSRYDGVESAMNEALERSPCFRVGISATPFTSCIEQLVGLALICGIVSDENSQKLRACLDRSCLDLVTRHACADSSEAARELKTFVDSFTVGVRALSERYPDVTAALCEQVNRVEMTCKVRIIKPSETQTRKFDEYLAAMETRRGARGQMLDTCARAELVPMGADAVSADSVLELVREVVLEEESKIVIFVPSCIASIAAMLWAHLRSRMPPWRVGLIDKDAKPDQRAEILRSFNSTDESTAIRILIATSETSGVGVDMTCAKRVVLLTTPWTGASVSQCLGRTLRIFAPEHVPGARRVTLLMPICAHGSSVALARFSRAAIRSKLGQILFPSFHPSRGMEKLNVTVATSATLLTLQEQANFATRYADPVRTMFHNGDELELEAFVDKLNRGFATELDAASVNFLFEEKSMSRRRAPARSEVAPRVVGGTAAREKHRSNAGLEYYSLSSTNQLERTVLEYAKVRRGVNLIRSDDEITHGTRIAAELQDAIRTASLAKNQGMSWTPSESARFGYLCAKTVDPQAVVRRFMICASALSNSNPFAVRRGAPTKHMLTGIELEKAAMDNIAATHGFTMLIDVDQWTKMHPIEPTILCATPDGMTTTGVLVEVKFVHNFRRILSHNGAIEYYRKYYPQVQAQMAVFDATVALLVFYTIDGADGELVSLDFRVDRDPNWFESNKDLFLRAIEDQRRKFPHEWRAAERNDDGM